MATFNMNVIIFMIQRLQNYKKLYSILDLCYSERIIKLIWLKKHRLVSILREIAVSSFNSYEAKNFLT